MLLAAVLAGSSRVIIAIVSKITRSPNSSLRDRNRHQWVAPFPVMDERTAGW